MKLCNVESHIGTKEKVVEDKSSKCFLLYNDSNDYEQLYHWMKDYATQNGQ